MLDTCRDLERRSESTTSKTKTLTWSFQDSLHCYKKEKRGDDRKKIGRVFTQIQRQVRTPRQTLRHTVIYHFFYLKGALTPISSLFRT